MSKRRLTVIWRRTLIIFIAVQAVGICIFGIDLRAALRGQTDTNASTLVALYASFVSFSGLVLWGMGRIRAFFDRNIDDGS